MVIPCIQYNGVFWALFAVTRSGKSFSIANRMSFFRNDAQRKRGRDTNVMDMIALIVSCYEECLIRDIPVKGVLAQVARRDPFTAESVRKHYLEGGHQTGLSERVSTLLLERLAGAEDVLALKRALRRIVRNVAPAEKLDKARSVAIDRLIKKSLAADEVEQVAVAENRDWVCFSGRNRKRGPFKPRGKKTTDGETGRSEGGRL